VHPAAADWVQQWAPAGPVGVLDVGGRDVNGTVRHLFHPDSVWTAVDLIDDPSVTWAGDFLDFCPDWLYDVVLHLEVAEHTEAWRDHIRHAASCLTRGGLFVLTAAGPARSPHSAVDGGGLRQGEHYANVQPDVLAAVLVQSFRWSTVDTTPDGMDVRAVARRL
jgi:hypothetical protein